MNRPKRNDPLLRNVSETLGDLLETEARPAKRRLRGRENPDLILRAAGKTFLVEFRRSPNATSIAASAKLVRESARSSALPAIPLVAVPYMGEVAQGICEKAGVSWLDLSGNAHIVAPGIRVIVRGNPNRFRTVGRPPSLFAPKSSRIIRWLLVNYEKTSNQRGIAKAVGIDEGFVSRIVSRLVSAGYVVREDEGAVRVVDPDLLLDDWREAYDFARQTIYRGHIVARSGDALMETVSNALSALNIEYAVTGLAAAWIYTKFAGFRLFSAYLSVDPSPKVLEEIGFKEGQSGANVWLIVPRDQGVFHGAVVKDQVRCAHPVQVYLDLKGHPERAAEAAERLRTDWLRWGQAGKNAKTRV